MPEPYTAYANRMENTSMVDADCGHRCDPDDVKRYCLAGVCNMTACGSCREDADRCEACHTPLCKFHTRMSPGGYKLCGACRVKEIASGRELAEELIELSLTLTRGQITRDDACDSLRELIGRE